MNWRGASKLREILVLQICPIQERRVGAPHQLVDLRVFPIMKIIEAQEVVAAPPVSIRARQYYKYTAEWIRGAACRFVRIFVKCWVQSTFVAIHLVDETSR
jgi:hypothetical protein